VLRRCVAHGKGIAFHIDDFASRVLQLSLSNDSEYEGGRLVYAAEGKMHIPERRKGTITVHNNSIVHGVTRLERGVRHSLYLIEK